MAHRKTLWWLLVMAFAVHVRGQANFQSPCPRIFVYEPIGREPGKWYGIITLLSETDLAGVWLRLILDRPSLQLGNWFGEVVTQDNKDFLIKNRNQRLKANEPKILRFFIKYDLNGPIPRLTELRLNARTICPENLGSTPPPTTTPMLITSGLLNATTPVTPPTYATTPVAPAAFGSTSTSDTDGDYPVSDFEGGAVPSFEVECGTVAVQPSPLISYGEPTHEGEFPWHAALYQSKANGLSYVCGGSLISKFYVITVGHCVSRPKSQTIIPPDHIIIYLGKYYLNKWSSKGVQTCLVSDIFRHPKYDSSTYANDIALIKLASPAQYTDYVRPVCLWSGPNDESTLSGKFGSVVGWGFDQTGKLTETLTKLKLPIVPKDTCLYSFDAFYSRFTSKDSFCAGYENGTNVCNGDSGGGMVFHKETGNRGKGVWELRGMVSISVALRNQNKCDPKHYVVFTDVAKYLDFINQVLRS